MSCPTCSNTCKKMFSRWSCFARPGAAIESKNLMKIGGNVRNPDLGRAAPWARFHKFSELAHARSRDLVTRAPWNLRRSCPTFSIMCKKIVSRLRCFAPPGAAIESKNLLKIGGECPKFRPGSWPPRARFQKFLEFSPSRSRDLVTWSTWNLHRSCPTCSSMRKKVFSHWRCFARPGAAIKSENLPKIGGNVRNPDLGEGRRGPDFIYFPSLRTRDLEI